MDESTLGQKMLSEAIGTALLVFVGAGSVPATLLLNGDRGISMADLGVIALAWTFVVIALVYTLGHVSGMHVNPAVSLGLAISRQMPWRFVPAYMAAQLVGAVVGAFGIAAVLGSGAVTVGLGSTVYGPGVSPLAVAGASCLGTFVLVFVVLGVIHRKAAPGFAGIGIGTAVGALVIVLGASTAASINPAVNFGPMVVLQIFGGSVPWEQLPVYVIAQLAGGAVAAFVFQLLPPRPQVATSLQPSEVASLDA
ncbi:MIP/aquaporin family protein [Agromyces italicus]|uniref:MIP/aquaporin family protein n=1 Tax=Agromyces italicus TaxID=279572 RepID=UPI0003B477DE|nr:MIP/aquaporin family protein [Agromyces italicus]